MAFLALIYKLDVLGLSPMLLCTASILTIEWFVFGLQVHLALPIDPVCLNFSIILFTADEVKSLFLPYFVRNFELWPPDFNYFLNIVQQ